MLLDDHELPPRGPSPTEEIIKIILMAMLSIYGLLRLLDDIAAHQ